jgi:hypothetical protein
MAEGALEAFEAARREFARLSSIIDEEEEPYKSKYLAREQLVRPPCRENLRSPGGWWWWRVHCALAVSPHHLTPIPPPFPPTLAPPAHMCHACVPDGGVPPKHTASPSTHSLLALLVGAVGGLGFGCVRFGGKRGTVPTPKLCGSLGPQVSQSLAPTPTQRPPTLLHSHSRILLPLGGWDFPPFVDLMGGLSAGDE